MITCYDAAWEKVKYDWMLVQRNGHVFVYHPRSDGFCWLVIGPILEFNRIGGG